MQIEILCRVISHCDLFLFTYNIHNTHIQAFTQFKKKKSIIFDGWFLFFLLFLFIQEKKIMMFHHLWKSIIKAIVCHRLTFNLVWSIYEIFRPNPVHILHVAFILLDIKVFTNCPEKFIWILNQHFLFSI